MKACQRRIQELENSLKLFVESNSERMIKTEKKLGSSKQFIFERMERHGVDLQMLCGRVTSIEESKTEFRKQKIENVFLKLKNIEEKLDRIEQNERKWETLCARVDGLEILTFRHSKKEPDIGKIEIRNGQEQQVSLFLIDRFQVSKINTFKFMITVFK